MRATTRARVHARARAHPHVRIPSSCVTAVVVPPAVSRRCRALRWSSGINAIVARVRILEGAFRGR
eukprot:9158731-Alexandrium_andersonii.AAC.1